VIPQGGFWGLLIRQMMHCYGLSRYVKTNVGFYALIGATAMLAGVFRSTLSLAALILEGTGQIQVGRCSWCFCWCSGWCSCSCCSC